MQVQGAGAHKRAQLLAGERRPYPPALRAFLRSTAAWGVAEVARAHFELGEHFGREGRAFLEHAGYAPQQLAAAGSHGQTVFHHDGDPRQGSLQLGDAAVVAAQLSAPVVGDFRWSDLAAGGQGAPISPYADWVLHRREAPWLAILNLGGIANLTVLAGDAPPLAWDCGPANGPLDALVYAERGADCDRDGILAAQGRLLPELFAALRADPYFARPLPRSTGLERFGRPFGQRARQFAPAASLPDLLATLVELVAWSVADSLERAGQGGGPVFLCGGGARNPVLAAALRRRLTSPPGPRATRVVSYAELGWDPDLREAVAFALLADAWQNGEPASWPSTTGAAQPALLGKLALPAPSALSAFAAPPVAHEPPAPPAGGRC